MSANELVIVFSDGTETIVNLMVDPDRHTRNYLESTIVDFFRAEAAEHIDKRITEIKCYDDELASRM